MTVSIDEQMAVIRRGVDSIVSEDELRRKLETAQSEGRPLRVKYGIDPTAIDVHLGHTVPLRKLRQFQQLGHLPIIVIGNYTALVGDPSGKDETRAQLDPQTVEANAVDYLQQVGKIIDLDRAETVRNGDWFSRMSFLDVMDLMSRMTVAQIVQRDDFAKRLKAESAIYLHECVYSLMQGRDSVEIAADVELGGTEQLFSLMVGRDLQRAAGQEPQVCITLPILVGTDGVRRMGKSLGNYIGVSESPEQVYGKVMSISDEVMRSYFELLTDVPAEVIGKLLAADAHPKEAKVLLAKTIVTEYHGAEAAEHAAEQFQQVFRDKEDPDDIPSVDIPAASLKDGKLWVAKLLVTCGLAPSNRQAKSLVTQGAVTVGPDRTRLDDPEADVEVIDGMIVRVGSRKFAKITLV